MRLRPNADPKKLSTMTWCFGCATETAAYVVADAAVTRPADAPLRTGSYSSFLEAQVSNYRHTIEEGVLKVTPVGDRILAVAGDASLCGQATELFVRHPAQTPEEFFLAVESSLLPTKGSFELLVAQPGVVVRWDSDSRSRFTGDSVWIGGISPELIQTMCRVGDLACLNNLEPRDFLATLQGAYQSLVLRNGLIAQHVGGAVMGAFTSADGSGWLSDTMFAILEPALMSGAFASTIALPDLNLVHLLARDRVAFAAPVLVRGKLGIKVLAPVDLTATQIEAVINKVGSELVDVFGNARAEHWVFISRSSSLVLVMRGGVQVAGGRLVLDKQVAALLQVFNFSLSQEATEVSLFLGLPGKEGGLAIKGPIISSHYAQVIQNAFGSPDS